MCIFLSRVMSSLALDLVCTLETMKEDGEIDDR